MDERHRFLLTTGCHIKKDNLDFSFIVSIVLRMSPLKHTYRYLKKKICFLLYIMLSMILQIVGGECLFAGIVGVVASDHLEFEGKDSKFAFWYQCRKIQVSVTA